MGLEGVSGMDTVCGREISNIEGHLYCVCLNNTASDHADLVKKGKSPQASTSKSGFMNNIKQRYFDKSKKLTRSPKVK